MSRNRRVLICSASALTPLGQIASVGDEAVTDCLVAAIRRLDPKCHVSATLNLKGLGESYLPPGRLPVRPLRRLARAVRDADLIVMGGGTLLQENVSVRPLVPVAGLLRYLVTVSAIARLSHRPVVVAYVGAEALDHRRSRAVVRAICASAQAVSTRDHRSAELLADITGRTPLVAADALFLEPRETFDGNGSAERHSICVSLMGNASPGLVSDLARILKAEADRGSEIVLIPMDRRPDDDASALSRLAANVGHTRTLSPATGWREVVQEIAHARACIGMRLHFLIFAALTGRPTLALTSSPKTVAFAAELGLSAVQEGSDGSRLDAAWRGLRTPDARVVDGLRDRAEMGLAEIARVLG